MEHNNPDDVGKAEDAPATPSPSEAPAAEAPAAPAAPTATPAHDEALAPTADPDIVKPDVLRLWEQSQTLENGHKMATEIRQLRDKVRHLELEVQRLT